MKKALFIALLATAACASAKKEEAATILPPGQEVLATFTGEVDLAAGTFTIRASPVPAGSARNTLTLSETTDVAVTTNAGTYTQAGAPTGTCAGGTWGAQIKLANINAATAYLGGVYAYITEWTAGTPLNSCNSSAAPQGMTSTWGIWSYGTVTSSGVNNYWWFPFSGVTRYTFKGEIAGAKVFTNTGFDAPVSTMPAIADNGSATPGKAVVFASSAVKRLEFSSTSGTRSLSAAYLPNEALCPTGADTACASATSVATDSTRIWFTTATNGEGPGQRYVGYMNKDGTGAVAWNATNSQGSFSIAGGPLENIVAGSVDSAGMAFFRGGAGLSGGSIDYVVGKIDATTGEVSTAYPSNAGNPVGLALDSSGNVVVATPNGGANGGSIERCLLVDFRTDTPFNFCTGGYVDVGVDPVPAACQSPFQIIRKGPGEIYWYVDSYNVGAVCELNVDWSTNAGTVTKILDAERPTALAIGPDGNVWVTVQTSAGPKVITRVIKGETGQPYSIAIGTDATSWTPYSIANSNGYLWVTSTPESSPHSPWQIEF